MAAETSSRSSSVLVGRSPQIRQILRKLEKLGRSDSPVLLLGETGTGKEVLARAIHQVRAAGPFVPIDCSALSHSLMESELFGHTRGAFTGAVAAKTGLLELAHGGTAFFDEIGEIPPELQVKLLRVLQDKEIRPVGSLVWRKADFRIIAATNRDLQAEVERGRFRRDLFYRLNVITVRLPPLRERKEDIPLLAEYFLARHGGGRTLPPEVLDAMMAYDWPGNVRELENCIERLVAVNSGPELRLEDLPSSLQDRSGGAAPPPEIIPLRELEKRTILAALECANGDRLRAARMLGIGRTTLYRKLKEYGITRSVAR